MVVGFVVVFVTPYLLADIGAGLGYIWGGFAFLTSIWAWFFMPELKVSPFQGGGGWLRMNDCEHDMS